MSRIDQYKPRTYNRNQGVKTVLKQNRAERRGARIYSARQGPQISVDQLRKNSGEKKGVDTEIAIAGDILDTTNTNGDSFVLNLIQTGNGSWNRVGRKVYLKSARIRGVAQLDMLPAVTTSALYTSLIRMVVVWDKQPSGNAIPTYDSIFGSTAQDGTESTDCLDAVKYDEMGRFSVLRDKVIELSPFVIDTTGSSKLTSIQCQFDEYIKLGNKEVVYSGQSTPMTIADISTGALYLYFRQTTNTGGATGNIWRITDDSKCRLRYSD